MIYWLCSNMVPFNWPNDYPHSATFVKLWFTYPVIVVSFKCCWSLNLPPGPRHYPSPPHPFPCMLFCTPIHSLPARPSTPYLPCYRVHCLLHLDTLCWLVFNCVCAGRYFLRTFLNYCGITGYSHAKYILQWMCFFIVIRDEVQTCFVSQILEFCDLTRY